MAEALGWPFDIKRMVYRPTELLTNRLLGTTLLGIDRAASSPLAPPWPELVISAGRRNEPVARWIRRQAGAGSRLKLVHVGRPWAPLDAFDLIVTTPQYALPRRPNVLHTEAPMHRVDAAGWPQPQRSGGPGSPRLPEPWIAVMLGGHVGRWTFGERAAVELTETRLDAMVEGHRWLAADIDQCPHSGRCRRCRSSERCACRIGSIVGDLTTPRIPTLVFWPWLEQLIVTSDSMSMLVEAKPPAKPVFVFDLGGPDAGGSGFLPSRRALIWWPGRRVGARQSRAT